MVEFSKIIRKVQGKKEKREEGAGSADRSDSAAESLTRKPFFRDDETREESQPKEALDQEETLRIIKPLFVQKLALETFRERISSHPVLRPTEREAQAKPESSAPIVEKDAFVAYPGIEEDAFPVYEKVFSLAKKIYRQDIKYEEVNAEEIRNIISELAGVMSAGNEELVELALTYTIPEEASYLFQHATNVSILTLLIGIGLDYEVDKLVELGITAFLHDIGMTRYEDMAQLPRKLTPKEQGEIKNHVETGDQILRKINHGLGEAVLISQYEIHERLDGSGYPRGKKIIHDYAKIIALADAFESMMHPRPFRPKYSLMEVYRRLFDSKNKYEQSYIKVMVDRVGFFPNGSYVQLNTKEIGRVVRQNPRAPLRPVIRIEFSATGQRLDEQEYREINLNKYPTIHVKKCYLEEDEKGQAIS